MGRAVRFAGTTAVITGGASGIGRGMAEAFLAAGSNVVIADIDQATLDAAAAELGVLGVRVDVAEPESVEALAERTMAEYGEVHVVCNNAGVGPFAAIESMSLDDWRWVLDVNLYGVIHGVRAFLPLLQRNSDWGHVVNTSSVSVMVSPPNAGAYAAGKAAVLGLTEVLSAELKAKDSVVAATALLPGAVRSNIKESLRSRPPTGGSGSALYEVDLGSSAEHLRFIEPREVGEMVVSAVRSDQLHLVTHAEHHDLITGWANQIANGAASATTAG